MAIPAQMEEKENFIMRGLHKAYAPFFEAALKWPKRSLVVLSIPVFACVILFPILGRDFMPKLEEGNLWIRVTLPMSISYEKSAEYTTKMRRILRGCPKDPKAECNDQNRTHPEVVTVVSQLGRPDDGTDVTGYFNVEFFAPLMPFDKWPHHQTKEELTDQLDKELGEAFPFAVFNFSQYISDNVEEATAGVKGENSVKVFGPNLVENEQSAQKIVDTLGGVKGITDLGLIKSLGQPNIRISPDRTKLARYGLNTGDVDAVVQSAVGGNAVVQVYEGEKQFDLTVRWLPKYRESLEAMREITVSTPDGMYIPLGQIATIEQVEGPTSVYRQDGQRYSPVKFGVRGRDLAGAIGEAQSKIGKPRQGMHLEWEGEIQELHKIEQRLMVIIPLTILIIGFLTFTAVKNWVDTLIVLIAIPVACSGGVLALLVTGVHFSVSAAMGFVSIFGIAIQDAILVVTYFQRLRNIEGHEIEQAAREAAEKRFRPVLMTTLVATLGLLPAALSNGIGSQTQKPLAIVVIGGSLILAILTRVMQPPLLVVAHKWLESIGRGVLPPGGTRPPPPGGSVPPPGSIPPAPPTGVE
jgi:cobalt-zinc-cadmium resistance protein CzcA